MKRKRLITKRHIANELGISVKRLNRILEDKGFLCKKIYNEFQDNKVWFISDKYKNMEDLYFIYYRLPSNQTIYFTDKGKDFIMNLIGEDR